MKVGISPPVRELKNDLDAIRAFAQGAEVLGYTHLRVPDLVLRRDGGHLHEPMTLLAYVAAITERIELDRKIHSPLPNRLTNGNALGWLYLEEGASSRGMTYS